MSADAALASSGPQAYDDIEWRQRRQARDAEHAMVRTVGPKGEIILGIHDCLKGQRRGARSNDPTISATIEVLDQKGMWHWVRHGALWQAPQHLSEDEQLAMVFVELRDVEHQHHYAVPRIEEALGPERILAAVDSLADQRRLDKDTWVYWCRRAGRPGWRNVPNDICFADRLGIFECSEESLDDQNYAQFENGLEVWVGRP